MRRFMIKVKDSLKTAYFNIDLCQRILIIDGYVKFDDSTVSFEIKRSKISAFLHGEWVEMSIDDIVKLSMKSN